MVLRLSQYPISAVFKNIEYEMRKPDFGLLLKLQFLLDRPESQEADEGIRKVSLHFEDPPPAWLRIPGR